MRVPISWLKEYVDFDISAEEVADLLTMSGTETEAIEIVGSDCKGVLVGEVTNIDLHPSSDNLRVCEIDMGGRKIQVVCGADNFSVEDKVPVIEAEGVLPDGTVISEAEIKGVRSSGMMCSERELALSDDHAGIMILPRDSLPGTPVAGIVGPPEIVLVLEVTWNRSDCLSIIGIAREVAALVGAELKLPEVGFVEAGEEIDKMIEVHIEDPNGCPRYTARLLTDVELDISPMWMQRRLAACGVRSINNLVDITNYVMLETGHPLHAFDHSLLEGEKIIVRRGAAGDKMATLDGVERVITSDVLLIADESRPIAVAGVMGGAGSEINEETQTVLLESASFDPATVRKGSTSLHLTTESSHRFERGVDPMNVEWASRRAAFLMVTVAGATACKGVIDEFPGRADDVLLSCSFDRIRSLLGINISDDEAVSILNSLRIAVTEREGDAFTVQVPSYRRDVTIEADVIEEIARVHGADNVPAAIPAARIVPGATDVKIRAVESCRERMIGLGFSETMHYSFLSDKLVNLFGVCSDDEMVVLPNPVSADHSIMRPSLIPQLVESMGRNLARQVPDLAFFEMGRVFMRATDGSVSEEDRLALGLMGNTSPGISGGMDKPDPVVLFLALKGAVERLCAGQRVACLEFVPCSATPFEEGSAVDVFIRGVKHGRMGLLGAGVRENWRMTDPVAIAELELSTLVSNAFDVSELVQIPAYPSISRDVAMLVSEDVTHEQVMKVIKAAAPKDLTAVNLFDIFKGKGVADSNKSLAYSLVYRSAEHTLTDEDANGYHEAIKAALVSELNVEIR